MYDNNKIENSQINLIIGAIKKGKFLDPTTFETSEINIDNFAEFFDLTPEDAELVKKNL